MSARKPLLLIAAAVIAYGAFHVTQRKAPSTEVENAPLYPGLIDRLNDTRSINIQTANDSFTLKRDGERWAMVERDGFAVKFDLAAANVLLEGDVLMEADAAGEFSLGRAQYCGVLFPVAHGNWRSARGEAFQRRGEPAVIVRV